MQYCRSFLCVYHFPIAFLAVFWTCLLTRFVGLKTLKPSSICASCTLWTTRSPRSRTSAHSHHWRHWNLAAIASGYEAGALNIVSSSSSLISIQDIEGLDNLSNLQNLYLGKNKFTYLTVCLCILFWESRKRALSVSLSHSLSLMLTELLWKEPE